MIINQSIVAVYASHAAAEAAVTELRQSGFDMKKLTIAGLPADPAAGGLSTPGPTLHSLGLSQDTILHYESAIRAGKIVLLVGVDPQETIQAKVSISHTQPESWDYHH